MSALLFLVALSFMPGHVQATCGRSDTILWSNNFVALAGYTPQNTTTCVDCSNLCILTQNCTAWQWNYPTLQTCVLSQQVLNVAQSSKVGARSGPKGAGADTAGVFTKLKTDFYCSNRGGIAGSSAHSVNINPVSVTACANAVQANPLCSPYFSFGRNDGWCDCVPLAQTTCVQAAAVNYDTYIQADLACGRLDTMLWSNNFVALAGYTPQITLTGLDCSNLCSVTLGCTAWQWNYPSRGTCVLSQQVLNVAQSSKAGSLSGRKCSAAVGLKDEKVSAAVPANHLLTGALGVAFVVLVVLVAVVAVVHKRRYTNNDYGLLAEEVAL